MMITPDSENIARPPCPRHGDDSPAPSREQRYPVVDNVLVRARDLSSRARGRAGPTHRAVGVGARNRDSTWRRTQRQRDPRGVRIPCRRRVLGRPPPRSLCAIRSTRQAQNVTVTKRPPGTASVTASVMEVLSMPTCAVSPRATRRTCCDRPQQSDRDARIPIGRQYRTSSYTTPGC